MIDLMDDPGGDSGTPQTHKGAATVAGIWFSATSNGDVALLPAQGATAGAIEHLSTPKAIDAIALSGVGSGLGGQDDKYDAFFAVGTTLYASSGTFGDYAHPSTDNGKTFQTVASSSTATPNAQWIWLSKDSAATWHLIDDIGNVWNSTTGPVATTSWTRTWQPEATPPVPDPVPAADCQSSWHQDYFAADSQRAFFVSSDGKTMIYNAGADGFVGVCRSTDSGNNFLPVTFPNPPNGSTGIPYVILFTSDKNGIAAYANDLEDANTSYVYYTADGGATWTLSTLPTMASQFALTSGFAAPDGQHLWVEGFTNDSPPKMVLWKSSDGGKTWKDVSAAITAANAGAMYKLHTGFALDANNIWVGGDNGGLAYSPSGGE
jgi:hypothetical protein